MDFDLSDIAAILRRRWLLLVLPIVVIMPIVIAIAMILPPIYTSKARILVETQQIPDDLARSTVTQSAAERIQFIEQRLLTRQNLLEIAAQYQVFAQRTPMTPSEIVEAMLKSTEISGIATGGSRRAGATVTGVEISFTANNAQVASRVANEFVSRILAQNVQQRTDRATGTLAFFDREVQRLAGELDARADVITRFKNDNLDALPDTLPSRQTELNALRERVVARTTQQSMLEDRIAALENRIAVGAPVEVSESSMSPQERELSRLRSSLTTRRAMLTESHPYIRQLVASIAALEAEIKTSAPAAGAGTDASEASRSLQMSETMSQLDSARSQLQFLRDQTESDLTRIADLENSVSRTPGVEMELNALQRNYDALRNQYESAVLKRSQAELGERLEAGQQAERFEVVEQAVPPERPDSPNRPLIVAGGFVGSAGLGVGFMILAEMLNRSLRTARDFERRLQIRPIVSIPYVQTPSEARLSIWKTRLLVLAVLVGIPAGAVMLDRLFIPLPILIGRVLETLGAGWVLEVAQAQLGS